jgi:predicted glycosyltransferase/tRNA A-37 threonylcarbamoyl transferase component Bud32
VKYRVGRGVGAVLRVHSRGGQHLVSARSFEAGLAARNFQRALAAAPPPDEPIEPVSYAADLDTVFWAFPSDRRIGSLSLLHHASEELERLVGRPCMPRLVAYVPEKAATARCIDDRARTLAYVKVYAGNEGRRTRSVHDALSAALDLRHSRVLVPRALAYDEGHHALVMAPIGGETLAALGLEPRRSGLAELGMAIATLHEVGPLPGLRRVARRAPERLTGAAETIGTVRPDVADDVARLAAALTTSPPDEGDRVCVHGDLHRKNAILLSSRVALLDLDQMGLGQPAADVGSLLAGLRYLHCVGALSSSRQGSLTEELLDGYRSVRKLPDRYTLSWHTAASLLDERALRSVTRVRPAGLKRLDATIAAARSELASVRRRRRPRRLEGSKRPRPPLLLHCQHALGLGHLTRSLALAAALAERFEVVILSGGPRPAHIDPPPGVQVVQLPALARDHHGRLLAEDRRRSVGRVKMLRRQMIVDAVRRFSPAVVVVELFPFGRRAFAGEIVAMLDAARALPGVPPLVACSVRDILVGRGDEQAAFDEWACSHANAHFDLILAHSDPSFARLEESFSPRTPLRMPVIHTGFVARDPLGPIRRGQRARTRRVVVSAGGGRVGESLLHAAVEAQPELWRSERIAMRLIAGPFLAGRSWRDLRARAHGREGLELRRSVPNLKLELCRATASVSQCGYNTAVDILQARVPALVVPFTAPGEDEQTRRANRLAALGAVRVLDPRELDGPTLASRIRETVRTAAPDVALDLNGADASAKALWAMLNSAAPARVPGGRG